MNRLHGVVNLSSKMVGQRQRYFVHINTEQVLKKAYIDYQRAHTRPLYACMQNK